MTDDRRDLWNEVCMVLGYHNKPGDTALETLNRLIRKVPQLTGRTDLPTLAERTAEVREESWHLERLRALLTALHITDLKPSNTRLPLVVLRWQNTDYLIDGRRRINYWTKIGAIGSHTVLVVEVPSSIGKV